MKTEEHLELILAFCRSRLELAAKRTPGKWWNEDERPSVFAMTPKCRPTGEGLLQVNYYGRYVGKDAYADAAFIAACAGAAEAGWRATIAAIEGIQQLAQTGVSWMAIHQHTLRAILAAYPLELLTEPTT